MTLYITNTKTGEMTPLDLAPLSRPPKRTRYNRPVRRSSYRRPMPASDLLLGVSAVIIALAFLIATTVGPA